MIEWNPFDDFDFVLRLCYRRGLMRLVFLFVQFHALMKSLNRRLGYRRVYFFAAPVEHEGALGGVICIFLLVLSLLALGVDHEVSWRFTFFCW